MSHGQNLKGVLERIIYGITIVVKTMAHMSYCQYLGLVKDSRTEEHSGPSCSSV